MLKADKADPRTIVRKGVGDLEVERDKIVSSYREPTPYLHWTFSSTCPIQPTSLGSNEDSYSEKEVTGRSFDPSLFRSHQMLPEGSLL